MTKRSLYTEHLLVNFQKAIKLRLFSCVVAVSLAAVVLPACSTQNFDMPPESQEFGQKVTYNTEVDVLFVVDTTGSMSKHQKALGDQIGTMVDAFNSTGLNYQIAVTTMDMSADGEKGKFIAKTGTPRILKSTTPNLTQVLAERLYIGDYDWHPMTRALESVKAALNGTNMASGPNAGFLRPDALLVLIFLSDGDDKSPLEDHKVWLNKLRPPLPYGDRSWVAQYMGVLPDDPTCKSSVWGYNEPGYKYIELATASGGVAESICDGDMRRALTNVKARVLEMMTEYPLGQKPVMNTIKVVVDGQVVPQSAENGWTYIEARNVLRFHGTAIPKIASTIKVDFERAGLKE